MTLHLAGKRLSFCKRAEPGCWKACLRCLSIQRRRAKRAPRRDVLLLEPGNAIDSEAVGFQQNFLLPHSDLYLLRSSVASSFASNTHFASDRQPANVLCTRCRDLIVHVASLPNCPLQRVARSLIRSSPCSIPGGGVECNAPTLWSDAAFVSEDGLHCSSSFLSDLPRDGDCCPIAPSPQLSAKQAAWMQGRFRPAPSGQLSLNKCGRCGL
jgi:hypothetical protein